MTTEIDLVAMLLAAIREIQSSHDVGLEQIEAARAQADETEVRFKQTMELLRAALGSGMQAQEHIRHGGFDAEAARRGVQMSSERSLRWERGFCDAYDALIGLAHYPSREDGVLRIAGILRELRLISAEMGVADVKEYSEPLVPPPIPAARNEASMKAFKLEAMEQVTRWAEASRAHVEARHDEAIQRTSLLVQKLVEEANALSESVFN